MRADQAAASAGVRDTEGAPKGRSRRALRGETEPREPRSSPTPRRGGLLARPYEGARLKTNKTPSTPRPLLPPAN